MHKKLLAVLFTALIAVTANAQEQTAITKPAYGPNMLRLMPVTVFSQYVGLGVSYERILDKGGKIGINIPVSLGLRNNNYGITDNDRMHYTVLVNPGIKFYPAGQRRLTYALGASIFAAFGSDGVYTTDYQGVYRMEDASVFRTGIMMNNYLQFNLTRALNIGLEVGVGPSYLNQYKIKTSNTNAAVNSNNINDGIDVMGQFSFHIGYRF